MSLSNSTGTNMRMDCLNVYITACRLAMTKTFVNYGDSSNRSASKAKSAQTSCYTELYNLLSTLRNFLSCYKCGKLASDAVKPSDDEDEDKPWNKNNDDDDSQGESSSTDNNNAEGGGGGEQHLVICFGCSTATKTSSEVDRQVRTLVQCFVKLCQYLQNKGFCNRNVCAASSRTQRDLTQLILDGAGFKEASDTTTTTTNSVFSRTVINNNNNNKSSGVGIKRSLGEAQQQSVEIKPKQGKMRKYRSKSNTESNGGDRKGCQCGHSTPRTGITLTCFGQRCPCYSNGLGCFNCKCRGCKNPKKPPVLGGGDAAGGGGESLTENNASGTGFYSVSSSTTSSAISSSCSSSPQPEDT